MISIWKPSGEIKKIVFIYNNLKIKYDFNLKFSF